MNGVLRIDIVSNTVDPASEDHLQVNWKTILEGKIYTESLSTSASGILPPVSNGRHVEPPPTSDRTPKDTLKTVPANSKTVSESL